VLRRLTASLVIALVLLGTGAPAVACAMELGKRDCCPEGTTMPCGGDGAGYTMQVAACCVSAPQSSSSWVSSSRSHAEPQDHSGSPDPVIAFAWIATLTSLRHVSGIPTHSVAPIRSDGSLTYLRTGRLRL
jgi:hypothetical protein